jgi:membrane protein implicated in regulation of membrane protease activity
MPKSLLLWTTRTPTNYASPKLEFVRLFRLNRWLTYLIIIPVIAAVTLLAIFFFAAFLGLFAAVLVVVAVCVWWKRWKLRRASTRGLQRESAAIKEIRCIETEMGKTRNQYTDRSNSESLCRNHERN